MRYRHRWLSFLLSSAMVISMLSVLPASVAEAAPSSDEISNESLRVQIGDLGQISSMTINNNRLNSYGKELNFVLPNDTSQQNNEAHQWMGEMIFSYRTSDDGEFPSDRSGFVEVDTNKTLAAGGSTTYSDASENLKSNPYIEKNVSDDKVEVLFKGQSLDSEDERTMKGFDVKSVYDMDTDDGSMLWSITLENTSEEYIEFGDVGLPMPWNNKYATIDDTYNNRTTVHTFAGADSGYAYAIRCSGEGNYILFTPVPETGARIEYIDQWTGEINGVKGTRSGSLYQNWTSDTGGWFPGLSVYYIHSKDIQKTGRGYYTDATSLVLSPGESKTYQFKFSAIRAGDNSPQESAEDPNNASDSVEERENNMRSVLYDAGMIDAVAVPGFQTAVNMETKLDLHYDSSRITDVEVDVQCIHENDPWDEEHIPEQTDGLVNNSRTTECAGNDSATFVETKTVDGEEHHIYELKFGCIGNNSVRVNYKLDGEEKFTQFEFNVLEELDETIEAHSDFMVNETQDNDPDSPTYGIYSDWYLSSGKDSTQQTHWGDDWSHDNINFMVMKNYLDPEPEEVESIEKYLIDFMWNTYMKNTQDNYMIANYLSSSGAYSDTTSPYVRTYSEVMEATGFFNMYRIEKAYPDLIEYREDPEWYLEKAFNIYNKRVGTGAIGFYGEQQIPDMIEALRTEGMLEEADALQEQFAKEKGTNMATAAYPYGSEFEYDNTGEEGAYAASKALIDYYPDDANVEAALSNMEKAEWKTRAMRGIQPTWYQYADPVFRGGESWWNFQYTASLAGSIMDDWLRYQDNDWDTESGGWAQRLNYAAKLSNFNAVNMGQISADSVGSVSWRYTMSKGGYGAQNVNDGGSRVMNNGWNDFSGESEEGLYGSLLSISSDVATDPVFGLTGYGCTVTKDGGSYTIVPADGIGKRVNVIDEKIYVELEQDRCEKAVIKADGTSIHLDVSNLAGTEHLSKIQVSGAGISDGFYSIKVNGNETYQCYVSDHEGTAYAVIPEGNTASVTLEKMSGGENQAPRIYSLQADEDADALVPFRTEVSAYDDGAPDQTLSYEWKVTETPEGGELNFDSSSKPYAQATATLAGTYKVNLTVSDGENETEQELEIQVGNAPEKAAPVIEEVDAVQNPVNTTVAELSGEAAADSVYGNELNYAWSVIDQPEGGNAVLAQADQKDAFLKAFAPGTYTLRLTVTDPKSTVYDEEISSYKDVEVEMSGNVDGIERAGTVITKTGTAPELPETMDIIHMDGTLKESKIQWDDVPEENYESKGEFQVRGKVEDTDLLAEITVMTVSGEETNLALTAQASAIIDTPQDLGGVAGLNDGYDPISSTDRSHGVWHNWLGEQGADAWVQYDWDSEVTIFQSNAYYFTDGNFVPKEVWYEYKDSNGDWRPLPNAEGCGTELNQYNVTTFSPVTTTAIRMNMSPKTLGCGVIEWQVMGYAENVIDKTQLRRVLEQAKALDLTLYSASEEQLAELDAAIQKAEELSEQSDASQEDIDAAAAKLARIIASLPTADGNLAYSAGVSTSFVSSWEKLSAVNDGKVPENSFNPGIARYGTWGNASEYETVTYTWNSEMALNGADVYFWYDGTEGDPSSGGIKVPKSYEYEYLDADGNWQKVENPSAYDTAMDGFNHTSFDEVKTTSIRITMTKQSNDGNGVGIMEWKVYGTVAPADKTALQAAVDDAKLENADFYTAESWKVFEEKLENAQAVLDEENASQDEVDSALAVLLKAQNELERKTDDGNIAVKATVSGICDYVEDLGGLATLNDNVDPASSSDKENGVWHNWNDRYESGTKNPQDAWIMYTWDEVMILEDTSVYYFTDGGGILMPESALLEYQNENDEWITVENPAGCDADQYNVTELGNVRAKALRLTMKPQEMSADDPVHGVGVIEWKVTGKAVPDTSELEKAIEEASGIDTSEYTEASVKAFEEALEQARKVMEDPAADAEDVENAKNALLRAMQALEPKDDEEPGTENIASEAKADGICNYDGQDGRPYDLGGLEALNDGYEPSDSGDKSHAVWHNWNDRYESGTKNPQDAWVSYTWEEPMAISSMDIYFFSDKGGIIEPKSISIEYLDAEGNWVPAEEAQNLSCVLDEYNRVKLAEIETKGIRLWMEPQEMNQDDPAHGVGILEWKVYGKAAEEVVTVSKEALGTAISEAEKRQESDYTVQSWISFERALSSAKAVMEDPNASQEEVDNAAALLNEAMEALEPVAETPPEEGEPADKTDLKALIDQAVEYTRRDYTEDSWNVFSEALTEAMRVDADPNATEDEIAAAVEALEAAMDQLVRNPSGDSGNVENVNTDTQPSGQEANEKAVSTGDTNLIVPMAVLMLAALIVIFRKRKSC